MRNPPLWKSLPSGRKRVETHMTSGVLHKYALKGKRASGEGASFNRLHCYCFEKGTVAQAGLEPSL